MNYPKCKKLLPIKPIEIVKLIIVNKLVRVLKLCYRI